MKAPLEPASCNDDDENGIHKYKWLLTCRVVLAVWKFPEAHLPHPLWQSLGLCSFGEWSGVDSQGKSEWPRKAGLLLTSQGSVDAD